MMLLKKGGRGNLRVFLFILIVLMCFNPYMTFMVYVPQLNVMGGFVAQFFCLILFLFLDSRNTILGKKSLLNTCMLFQLFGFFLLFVVHQAVGYLLFYITVLLVLLMISYVEKTIGIKTFYNYYNKWICLMAIGGVGVLVLAIIGVPPVYECTSPVSSSFTISSWIIGFTNTYRSSAGELFSFVRYSGFFDEPGAMAYWGIFALVFNKLFINNTKLEISLIILLLFTFSLGFYVQISVYLFLIYGLKRSRYRLPVIILVSLVVFGLYYTKDTEYSAIYDMSIGRIDRTAQVSGSNIVLEDNNRSDLTDLARKTFLENPVFGVGSKKMQEMEYMQDNPYETLASVGIVGTFFLYMPYIILLFLAIKNRDGLLLRLLIVLILGFMHRPFHTTVLAFFITYSLLYLYEKTYGRHKTTSVGSYSGVQ